MYIIIIILYTCTIHQVTFEEPSEEKFAALWQWMNKRYQSLEWPLGKRNTRPHEQPDEMPEAPDRKKWGAASSAAAVAKRTEKEEPERKKTKQRQGAASAVAEREQNKKQRLNATLAAPSSSAKPVAAAKCMPSKKQEADDTDGQESGSGSSSSDSDSDSDSDAPSGRGAGSEASTQRGQYNAVPPPSTLALAPGRGGGIMTCGWWGGGTIGFGTGPQAAMRFGTRRHCAMKLFPISLSIMVGLMRTWALRDDLPSQRNRQPRVRSYSAPRSSATLHSFMRGWAMRQRWRL